MTDINKLTGPELDRLYREASAPYTQNSFISPHYFERKSWRYQVEFNTACNLKCPMCINGNRSFGYEGKQGVMSDDLMEKILDKIASENPQAHLMPYANSEPFLHPHYHKCIESLKRRGLTCEIATNLHYTKNLEATIAARPDLVLVSLSGFSQPIAERAHPGCDIELVKKNLQTLSEIRSRVFPKLLVVVDYHRYKYNLHEIEPMRAYADALGFDFITVSGRVITMENAVQYLRHIEAQKNGGIQAYDLGPGTLDLNRDFPPPNRPFLEQVEQLQFHPSGIPQLYAQYPQAEVCPVADLFVYIRYDGTVTLCGWTDDARLSLGNYLDMTPDQIRQARLGHPLCKECLRYRLNLYFHLVDRDKWSPIETFKKTPK